MSSAGDGVQWPGALSAFWSMVVFLMFVGFATGFDWRWVFPAAAFWWALLFGTAMVRGRSRAHRASRPAVEASPTPAPRFELNAPDPAPGQCPVCGLEDLDELGVHDEMAAEIDPALVRVVAYGPHRAHYACAAVVPCVAAPKPAKHHCFGFSSGGHWTYCGCESMREGVPLPEGRGTLSHTGYEILGRLAECGCEDCKPKPPVVNNTLRDSVLSALTEGIEREAQRITIEVRRQRPKGGYMAPDVTVEQMGPLPEVLARPALETPHPTKVPGAGRLDGDIGLGAYWTCKFCQTKRWAASLKGAEWALIEHARTCEKRPAVGDAPPEWAELGVDTFAGAQSWRKHGFTPQRAKAWIQNGFCDPQAIAATGFRWPNDLRAAQGMPLWDGEARDESAFRPDV